MKAVLFIYNASVRYIILNYLSFL